MIQCNIQRCIEWQFGKYSFDTWNENIWHRNSQIKMSLWNCSNHKSQQSSNFSTNYRLFFGSAVDTTDNYNYFDYPLSKRRIQFSLVMVLTKYAPQNPKWKEFHNKQTNHWIYPLLSIPSKWAEPPNPNQMANETQDRVGECIEEKKRTETTY